MKPRRYIGPSIPGLIVRNTGYTGKLPEKIQKKCEEDRNFARLFVDFDKLPDAMESLNTQGSILHTAYARVAESEVSK